MHYAKFAPKMSKYEGQNNGHDIFIQNVQNAILYDI